MDIKNKPIFYDLLSLDKLHHSLHKKQWLAKLW